MKRRAGLVLAIAAARLAWGDVIANLNPGADAFVRSLDPAGNYGGAGALSVSGSAAVNGNGFQVGLLDSYLRFDAGGLKASADAAYGAGLWTVSAAVLRLTEQAAPNQTNFNRGKGAFEVLWLASDAWTEGTGAPNSPTSDGIQYQDESTYFSAGTDAALGTFTNAGANALQSFALLLSPAFVADVAGGGQVSLFLGAADSAIGFTFNSRSFGTAAARPVLQLTATAVPEPAALALVAGGLGICALLGKRRRA